MRKINGFIKVVNRTMRIPFTRYGLPQVWIYPAGLLVVMGVLAGALIAVKAWVTLGVLETLLALVLGWALSFFRDPVRVCPGDVEVLWAPADGRINDIEALEELEGWDEPVLRIGIFLSIFNVHINRAPTRGRLDKVEYKAGRYINAMHPDCGKVNEANALWFTRLDEPTCSLQVRQISGAIARRIVCEVKPQDNLTAGQAFGMIKFGSRTELIVPQRAGFKPLVAVGDKVKAGVTPMMRVEPCQK